MKFSRRTEGVEAELRAYDASRSMSVLKRWIFDTLPADTLDSTNGPNGQDCNDPEQRVDTIELDLDFTWGFPCVYLKYLGRLMPIWD